MLLNPLGELPLLVAPCEPLVGEHHDSVVGLAAERAAHALSRVAHRVESQEVVLADLQKEKVGADLDGSSAVHPNLRKIE